MLLIMGILRGAQKGIGFGWVDVAFVVLFAAAMSLIVYIRPKFFDL